MLKAKSLSSRIAQILMLVLIVGGLILSTPSISTPTFSCPGPPPRALRQLYLESASIVIARVGKSEVVRVDKVGDSDTAMTWVKTALFVSSTLKGDAEPVAYVNHLNYGEYQDELSSVKDGVDLLVFLQKAEGWDNYYVDMTYGLKMLSDADLKVYTSRISDLATIMKSGEPSDAQIVEWLVRCAEEPATRWEGIHELSLSQFYGERQNGTTMEGNEEESETQSAEAPAESEVVNDQEVRVEPIWTGASISANFAKSLTTEQKDRLITALVNTKALTNNDYSLLEFVQRWNDQRLVPYLLTQLERISTQGRSEELGDYYIELIMTTVAEQLGDDALEAAVKRFSGNEDEQFETYDEDDSNETRDSEVELSPEAQAAELKAAAQRRNTELQHFVTLALSTVPKPTNAETPDPVASTEP